MVSSIWRAVMKRTSIVKIIGAAMLASLLMVSQDCWPQVNAPAASAAYTPPARTYVLQLTPDKVWEIVVNTVSETPYEIDSEDASRLLLVAIGKPYTIRVGFGKKQERKQVIIEFPQKSQGVYDCYIKIEIQEFWPINRNWTKKTDDDGLGEGE